MIPEPNTHASGEEKVLLGEALSAVREEIRDTETGLANPASVGPVSYTHLTLPTICSV